MAAAIAAIRAQYPGAVSEGVALLVGMSLGAIYGAPLAVGEPAHWPRLVLVEGDSPEDLLINFLREVLYLYNGERWLLKGLRVTRIGERVLEAEARGEPFDGQKHAICKEIKAVTYHQAEIRKTPDGWTARVIFDV
jgi:pimeloyl-ACP methyl ester carboxylesterase